MNLRQGIQLEKHESLQKEPKKPVETLPKKELIDSKIWTKGQDVKHAIENTVDNYMENLIIDAVNEYNTLKDRQYANVREINKAVRGDRAQSATRYKGNSSDGNMLDDD